MRKGKKKFKFSIFINYIDFMFKSKKFRLFEIDK